MNNQIVKKSNLTPASFNVGKDTLTPAQTALLKLMQEKIEAKIPIDSEDIVNIYIKEIKKKETYRQYKYLYFDNKYGSIYSQTEYEIRTYRDDWDIKVISRQWFKLNIGSVIIKGRLLVVPIIEID